MPGPTPELIFDTFNAYQRSAALKAAVELGLFTAVGEGSGQAPDIARRVEAPERGVRILCDYLVVIGLLGKEGDRYVLTLDSATFLDRRSPAYMGDASVFLNSSVLMGAFTDMVAVVRRGGTVMEPGGTVAPDHPVWVDFARSMARMMRTPAMEIATLLRAEEGAPWKVLDIAAGHGLFGITLAERNPNAQIVALDWANVLAVATENARAAGVGDRHRTLPGSAFDVDFGSGYDVVLLTNFLHHFDIPTCEKLLTRVGAALKDGGRVVTLEFVPNEDRVSPAVSAAFSLIMLASTAAGDAYTFRELEGMFRNAGFGRSEMHQLSLSPQRVVVSHK